MKTAQLICDRCGTVEDFNAESWHFNSSNDYVTIQMARLREFDLCHKCAEKLVQWLQSENLV